MLNQISPALLWDVDQKTFDYQKGKALVIERVITRGNRRDWEAMYGLYTKDEIKAIIKKIAWLPERDMHYVSILFDIKLNNLRCFKRKQKVSVFH